MSFSAAVQAAILRLASYYTGNPISASDPGGLDAGGHRTNFIPILRDVAGVAVALGEAADVIQSGSAPVLTNEATIASAATVNLGSIANPRVLITGTTTITSFGTTANIVRRLRFAGALTLTHNATSLILPGGANITTGAGDVAQVESDGSGNWRLTHFQSFARAGKFSTVDASGYVASAAGFLISPTHGIGTGGANILTFVTGGAERARLDAAGSMTFGVDVAVAGKVAIGGTSLTAALNVNGNINLPAAGNGLFWNNITDTGISSPAGNIMAFHTSGGIKLAIDTTGAFYPALSAINLGRNVNPWANEYFQTAPVITSDARTKADRDGLPLKGHLVSPLNDAEMAAACDLAKEVGVYTIRSALAAKGGAARLHVGMTVQRAVAILKRHGLDPMTYGAICYDEWEAEPDIAAEPEVKPDYPGAAGRPAVFARKGWTAGSRYAFRNDELVFLVMRGLESRLAAIEARLAA